MRRVKSSVSVRSDSPDRILTRTPTGIPELTQTSLLLEHVFLALDDPGGQGEENGPDHRQPEQARQKLGVSRKMPWIRLRAPSFGMACGTSAWR